MNNIYQRVKEFKKKYPLTVAFRLQKHSSVIEKHLNPGEKVNYIFCGQKNYNSLMMCNTCIVALTDKRILIAQKRLLWGYFLTMITPDMYNDLKVIKGLIWSNIEIDTIKEHVYISNLDPKAADDIETAITEFMMSEKKKYGKKDK